MGCFSRDLRAQLQVPGLPTAPCRGSSPGRRHANLSSNDVGESDKGPHILSGPLSRSCEVHKQVQGCAFHRKTDSSLKSSSTAGIPAQTEPSKGDRGNIILGFPSRRLSSSPVDKHYPTPLLISRRKKGIIELNSGRSQFPSHGNTPCTDCRFTCTPAPPRKEVGFEIIMAGPMLLSRKANGVNQSPGELPKAPRMKAPAQGEKVVVRRLPPGLTEDEFVAILGDEWMVGRGKVDWFSYWPGKVSQQSVIFFQSRVVPQVLTHRPPTARQSHHCRHAHTSMSLRETS